MNEIPTDFAFEPPWLAMDVAEDEFGSRVRLTSEFFVVDDEAFFVRGIIELPILGTEESFAWGVWCSLSRQSYERAVERWDKPGAEREPPAFGWLHCRLPGYDKSTWLLKTMVHPRDASTRPWVEVEPGSHRLADEQTHGITIERWHALAKAAMAMLIE